MNEEKVSIMENSIRTVLIALITSILIWIASSLQTASNEITVLKTDVTYIKDYLTDSKKLATVVIENNKDIQDLAKRVQNLEDSQ